MYSYGLVLSEMVTGKLPFPGLPPAQITFKVAVQDERPPLPPTVNCISLFYYLILKVKSKMERINMFLLGNKTGD